VTTVARKTRSKLDAEAIGERIRILRTRQGITQAKLASEAHISESTIRNWESGRRAPRMGDGLAKVAELLRLEPGQILHGMDYGKEFRDG